MADDEIYYISDLTEPTPLYLVEGNVPVLYEIQPQQYDNISVSPGWQQDLYLWRVELYLVSKYQPQFAEASIWKLYSAAKERAKIVKEHHSVHVDLRDLASSIVSDLDAHVQWTPQKFHKGSYAETPGIGRHYQKQLEEL
jgi:hypothetical protein